MAVAVTQALARDFEVERADAPPKGVAVTVRGLSKSFGEKSVLRGLDLHVSAGQFIAIVGRSGCGKSTLLRVIADLEAATSGRVAIGEPVGGGTPSEARVMFQEPRLLPWASVLANVEVGLGAEGDTPDAKQRAIKALAAVGLADRASEWPSALSGGQKQRVALARALVSRPRLLALDEPLGALDALTRIEMQRLLENVWRREGFTALLVTHDVAEAIALADRVVLLENGVVALEAAIDLERPRHRGSPEFGRLEESILERLLGASGS